MVREVGLEREHRDVEEREQKCGKERREESLVVG
jgi:hypothetical protein